MSYIQFVLKFIYDKIVFIYDKIVNFLKILFGFFIKSCYDLKDWIIDKVEYFIRSVKLLLRYIFVGDVGNFMGQPSLISLFVYLFFYGGANQIKPVEDPGDYTVSIVGYTGELSYGLIKEWAEYQMIDNERARDELINKLPLRLGIGIKEIRVNELKTKFEGVGAILEIVRTSIEK